jgi:hypothetical protein
VQDSSMSKGKLGYMDAFLSLSSIMTYIDLTFHR